MPVSKFSQMVGGPPPAGVGANPPARFPRFFFSGFGFSGGFSGFSVFGGFGWQNYDIVTKNRNRGFGLWRPTAGSAEMDVG